MMPTLGYDAGVSRRRVSVREYEDLTDALLLQGGADVSPTMCGQTPLQPQWSGDIVRDRYEIEFIEGFLNRGKPVFGICPGAQWINVAFGGTLVRDITTQRPAVRCHGDGPLYDDLLDPEPLMNAFLAAPRARARAMTSVRQRARAPGRLAPVGARPGRSAKADQGAAPGSAVAPSSELPAMEPAARVLCQFRLAFNAVKAHFRQLEKRLGMGGAQVCALHLVQLHPGIGIKGLAQAMAVRQPTASNLVKSLSKQGMLEVCRTGADRRAVQLRVLPSGSRLLLQASSKFLQRAVYRRQHRQAGAPGHHVRCSGHAELSQRNHPAAALRQLFSGACNRIVVSRRVASIQCRHCVLGQRQFKFRSRRKFSGHRGQGRGKARHQTDSAAQRAGLRNHGLVGLEYRPWCLLPRHLLDARPKG